ncbi:MAG TPA: DUF4838 domain-containing protein [Opitutaceae bacterium]|nr:DUF4838 domain-containing protein [Opitutaceae bacterium]
MNRFPEPVLGEPGLPADGLQKVARDLRARVFGFACVVALAVPVPSLSASTPAEVTVFAGGRAALPILTPANPAPEEVEAAALLARVLGEAGNTEFTVRTEHAGERRGIFVGNTEAARRRLPPVDARAVRLDRDGFRIVVQSDRIFIQGAEPWGTRFGASWFLQKHADVRWFMPGPLGESIPRAGALAVPVGGEVHEPAWLSREFWGLGAGGDEWAALNGLRRRFAFSHNLSNVFTPEIAVEHPDWFPIVDGERVSPAPGDYRWQPDLTRDDVAAHAAAVASRHFEANPGDASFALGVNDSVRFDQSDATRAVVEPLRWHRGFPDYSDIVFSFMNRAAEVLETRWSDKKLGALAYFWAENTPRFAVHPRVLPYLTTDRSQYYDAGYAADDLALIRAWCRSGAETVGIYDYSYGSRFLVPRIYHREMVRALDAAHTIGARGCFAEMNSHWGFDAFKAWATARALWDGDVDLATLEDEFFNGFYGAAADEMRHFFAQCEARWMGQGGEPYWLKFYDGEDQALLFPPAVCAELRASLDRAAAAAENDSVRARVELTSRAFAVTEAFGAFDLARREVQRAAFGDASKDPGPLLDRYSATAATLTAAFAAARAGATPALSDMPLDPFTRNDPRPTLAWRHIEKCGVGACSHLAAFDGSAIVEGARLLAGRDVPNLAANGSFELEGDPMRPEFLFQRYGALPLAWRCQAMPTERGRVAVVETDAHAGARALRVEGAWDTEVFRWIPALPGRIYVLTGWLRGRISPGNTSALVLSFLDADNRPIGEHQLQSLPVGRADDWTEVVLADRAPEGVAWVGFGVSVARQVGSDFVEADDVQLRSVNPARAEQ